MRPAAARVSALAALALGALSAVTHCQTDASVTCEVNLPAALANTAQWMEVGVLPGACPPNSQLAGGLPDTGLVTRVAFEKGNTNPPPIGTLKKGSYAFAAVARGADCSVLATGCSEVDVTDARDVSITLTATAKPAGACEAGSTCFDARCVPATGAQDAGTGGGCAMNLVAAGPLGDPLYVPNAISEVASAPAAAATETGFLVTYREYDPNAGTAGLTVVWVDPRGVLTVGAPTSLPTQCAGQDETDAVALGYSSGTGVIVSARPSCNSQPAGFDAFPVDATGKVGQGVFTS